MIPPAIGFVAGLWLLHRSAVQPSIWAIVAAFGALAAAVLALWWLRSRGDGHDSRARAGLLLLTGVFAGVLAGVGAGSLQGSFWLERAVEAPLKAAELRGRVVDLPRHGERSSRFRLRTEGAPRRELQVTVYPARPDIGPGDALQLRGRLRPPDGRANPAGFDRAAWFYREGLHGRLNISAGDLQRLEDAELPDTLRGMLHQRRDAVRERLHEQGPELRHPGLVQALVIGERSAMTDAEWTAFLHTGTNHLMAISGLHVGLVAGFAALLAGVAWRYLPGLREHCPRRLLGSVAAASAALGYAALAGFSIPTQRALLMLLVVLAAVLLGRGGTPWRALLLAAVLILFWHPPSVLAPGFWFSFGAVAVILALIQGRQGRPGWREGVTIQVLLALAMLPLALAWFQLGAWVAPVANLVAVPVISFLVLPSLLTGAGLMLLWAPLGVPFLWLGDRLLALLVGVLQSMAQWPGAVEQHGVPLAAALLAGVAVLLLLLPQRRRLAPWVLLALVPLWLPLRPDLAHGELRLRLLDTGDQPVVLLETRSEVVVHGQARAGEWRAAVLPVLRERGPGRVDRLILSHGSPDAALEVLEDEAAVPVGEVWHPGGEIASSAARSRVCRAGKQWHRDGVDFRLLHPPRGWDASRAASCVLRVDTADGAILLAGSLRGLGEAVLLHGAAEEDLAARLVVATGGRDPREMALLQASDAPVLWLAGALSHGGGEAAKSGAPEGSDLPWAIRATGRHGALELRAGRGWEAGDGYRLERRRFWDIPPATTSDREP